MAGTALGGSLDAEITADDRAADGRVTVRVQGSDLRVDTLAIGTLDLRSTIDEPMAAAKVDATLAAEPNRRRGRHQPIERHGER